MLSASGTIARVVVYIVLLCHRHEYFLAAGRSSLEASQSAKLEVNAASKCFGPLRMLVYLKNRVVSDRDNYLEAHKVTRGVTSVLDRNLVP